jgi:type IV secretion system protein VirD4
MTPTRLLIGQGVLVMNVVVAILWGATQWTAALLGGRYALGAPWFGVFRFDVHYPWRVFEWWYAYDGVAPDVFARTGGLAATAGIAAILIAVGGSLWRARTQGPASAFGSARWAGPAELKRSGLLGRRGVMLGRFHGRYLRHDGPEHVMAFAPTRSGKGVGLVVPTLLVWPGSTIVHDIKGENWRLTAGWRARFSHCLCFNPTDPRSVRFNPLLEVRRGRFEVRDVQNIADILVDPDGALDRRNHWERTGHALLVGVILHVLYAERQKTLARVATTLSDPACSFEQTLTRMLHTPHVRRHGTGQPHPVVAQVARELLNKSDNERSGVLSTAMSFLALYRDPAIAHVTGASDWRIRDLVYTRHPVSLYLVVPPSDLSRTRPLVRLLLNQIGRRLTERLEGETPQRPRHRLLMMLDEFPALGRLDFFESALAFMAGYGIRAYLIAQSLNQIAKAYGEHSSILDNCHVRVAFATNDERTARRVSDTTGTATAARFQRNYGGHRLAPWLNRVTVSRQENARPLLTPGEVMQLEADEELVFVSGSRPIRARKLRYFEDPALLARCLEPPARNVRDLPPGRGDDWGELPIPEAPPADFEPSPPARARVEQRLFQDAGDIPVRGVPAP